MFIRSLALDVVEYRVSCQDFFFHFRWCHLIPQSRFKQKKNRQHKATHSCEWPRTPTTRRSVHIKITHQMNNLSGQAVAEWIPADRNEERKNECLKLDSYKYKSNLRDYPNSLLACAWLKYTKPSMTINWRNPPKISRLIYLDSNATNDLLLIARSHLIVCDLLVCAQIAQIVVYAASLAQPRNLIKYALDLTPTNA